MELVQQYGGIGKFRAEGEEQKMLQDLVNIVSWNNGEAVHIEGHRPEETKRFEQIVPALFPAFTLQKRPPNAYSAFSRNGGYYRALGQNVGKQIPEIVISSRLQFGCSDVPNGTMEVDLKIVAPTEADYFMTVAAPARYKPDCVDDFVRVLGEWYNSQVRGFQATELVSSGGEKRIEYGISEICALESVLQFYLQTNTLLEAAIPREIKVNRKQLNVLRRDAEEHENLAIRRMSKNEYDKLLQECLKSYNTHFAPKHS